jgi:hypothetical protein
VLGPLLVEDLRGEQLELLLERFAGFLENGFLFGEPLAGLLEPSL